MTKMEEKMDELKFLLKQLVMRSQLSVALSKDEQRTFLTLYTHDRFQRSSEIADKTLLPDDLLTDCITSMMDKGIPIEREVLNGKVYFRMNRDFKLKQAKEHIIKIDPEVTSQFQNVLLRQFFSS
jgi:hypothetical protein